MVKHNNVIPNGHFKKHWQNYVRTWFDQPARKTRRRIGMPLYLFIFFIKILFCGSCSSSIQPCRSLSISYIYDFILHAARQKKAVKNFPRPTAGLLRPVVHCQTLKYNMKSRAGRGFSLEELKVILNLYFFFLNFKNFK